MYLIVHTGSRNLGKQVCEYYQNAAADALERTNDGDDRVLTCSKLESMSNAVLCHMPHCSAEEHPAESAV
jgi:RNA-splicing ligase RtcB